MDQSGIFYLNDTFASLCGLPMRVYKKKKEIHSYSLVHLVKDPILLEEKTLFETKEEVGYFYTPEWYYYVYCRHADYLLVIGPSRMIPASKQDIRDLALKLEVPPEETEEFVSEMLSLVTFPLESLLQTFLALNFVLNHHKLTLQDLLIREKSEPLKKEEKLSQDEEIQEETKHNTLDVENALISMVRKGDIDSLLAWSRNLPAVRPGIIAQDTLRETKNLFIVTITLVSRAAIQGGMDSREALSLSDLYIQRLETLSSPQDISTLQFDMVKEYTRKVKKLNEKASTPLVRDVRRYILSHISEKILIEDIAKSVYLSRSRLCSKFKKESGMSVNEYVLYIKIEEAKELLSSTDHSLSQISNYLGFSSQSYFNSVFRKLVSMTPSKYRNKNKAEGK